jgi:hypothetical protein
MNFKTEFPCQPNRREYSRVNAVVPFGVRLVSPEERESLLSRICNQTTATWGGSRRFRTGPWPNGSRR